MFTRGSSSPRGTEQTCKRIRLAGLSPPSHRDGQKEQHDISSHDPWQHDAGKRSSPCPPSHDAQLSWGRRKMVNGRDIPLQRPGEAPQVPKGSLESTKGSPRRDPLAGHVFAPFLTLGLHRVLPLRPLPKATPAPSTGRVLGEFRSSGALEKVQSAEGGGNRNITH